MLNRASRASTDDKIHHKHGYVVTHRFQDDDVTILKTFRRRRYHSSHYAAALTGLKQRQVGERMRVLKRASMGYLQLCELQREDMNLRNWSFLYYELTPKGIAELSVEGIDIIRPDRDGRFAHSLMLDQVMDSYEIGAKAEGLTIEYHDQMPRKIQVAEKRYFISDQGPFSFMRDGRGRPVASVEVDTSDEPIAPADHERAAPVNKMREIVRLILDGTITKLYGFKKPYFIWVTRTPARVASFQWHLAKLTEKCPELRKQFLFTTHTVFGKRGPKPEPTGHMFTRPYQRAALPDFYLNKQEA
jgi:hypothetical protein